MAWDCGAPRREIDPGHDEVGVFNMPAYTPSHPSLKLYAALKPTEDLRKAYDISDMPTVFKELAEYTRWLLQRAPYDTALTGDLVKKESFSVVGVPSKFWEADFVGDDEPNLDLSRTPPAELIPLDRLIVYEFADADLLERFLDVVGRGLHVDSDAPISNAGVDLGVGSADHWCPATSFDTFGTRADARRTVAADALTTLRGKKVNVVIIDEGLDRDFIPPGNWGGGLSSITGSAGKAARTSHGMMIARSILDLAPDAVLYDVPLIPGRITTGFLSTAHAAIWELLLQIWLRRPYPRWSGPWIFVNAWAVFDRSIEPSPGNYTENNNPFGHPLINAVKQAIGGFNFDVIFAAGNCGEFCGSMRCGRLDRGPGRSIWGANALLEVITAGAVLTNEMWAGYSSQGPGPNTNGLGRCKPDFCAPSNFRETNDAAVFNTGTSAACAMTAGVAAALRSNPAWYQNYVPPAIMLGALTQGARKTQGTSWDERLGHGILDVAEAMSILSGGTIKS